MADTMIASIRYVKKNKDVDPSEKGYILHYAAPPGFPQNNFSIEPYSDIKVHNLRTEERRRYEDLGIKIAPINSSQMRPEYFEDDDWIERVYLPELHRSIITALGAKDITIFDWMLRKRAASFPQRNMGEKNEDQTQPSLSAHIGECSVLAQINCG
jgi:hypothetical protein